MMNQSRQERAAHRAGVLFANRESILETWLSLIEVDSNDPAAAFIYDQLDASVLALARWMLDEDPAQSRMSLLWNGIQPNQDMVVRAIVSMSLLPEAIRRSLGSDNDVDDLMPDVADFIGEITRKILRGANLELNDERWDEVSREIETRYEAQRIQRVRQLSVLIEIAHAVSATQDLDSMLDHVNRATTRLAGSDYTEISLFDSATNMLRCHLVYSGGGRRADLENTWIEQGLANEVLHEGREMAFPDYASACRERGIPSSSALDDGQQRAWMGAPMRRGEQIAGVIAVSRPLTSFDGEDLELLVAIARQTAVALENRRLIEAQHRHVAHLSAVNRLTRNIANVHDPEKLLSTATDLIHEFFDYGLVTIFLADPDERTLRMRSRSPLRVDDDGRALVIPIGPGSVVGRVASARQPVQHDDIREGVERIETPATAASRSEMAVPIIHSGKLLGVLDVQSPCVAAYDEHDLTTLLTIADQIAIGLENSRLFADEAKRSRELSLMLRTTRAAGSSLMIDEVLERLAEGIAEAAGTSNCMIHLYDEEAHYFRPAVMVAPDDDGPPEAFNDLNRIIPIEGCSALEQVLSDPFPLITCHLPDPEDGDTTSHPTLLVPLRSRQRTLGIAIVAPDLESDEPYPVSQMRLIQGVADSAALAVENARLYARAHGLAIAEERGRLAQEIHDTLAQGLTAISLQLDLADSYLPAKPNQAAKNVKRGLELVRQNLDQARRSVLDLRAADVHHMSLPDAVSQLLRRLGDESEISYDFSSEGLVSRLSARVEVGLYRIIEEALENARRHSQASHVRVAIRGDGQTVALAVEDDGYGFDPSSLALQEHGTSGFGLVGIRERARLLGGSLTISSNPGYGTSIRVTVPYEVRVQPAEPSAVEQGDTT